MEVYVIMCEQHYASHWRLIGVCSTKEKAQEMVNNGPDRVAYTVTVDEEI